MDILKFTFKLLKHGGIFLLRVVGILLPAAGEVLTSERGSVKQDTNEWHGIPNLEAIEHPLWEETYGPNRKPW